MPYAVVLCDEEWNLISMCRKHHSEQHQKGWRLFLDKYKTIQNRLTKLGWSWEYLNGRFVMYHRELKK